MSAGRAERRAVSAGYEKKLRLYDLNKMDAEPFVIEGVPDKVRCMAWHKDDNLLLTSYIDNPGIGQVPLHSACFGPQCFLTTLLHGTMPAARLPDLYP